MPLTMYRASDWRPRPLHVLEGDFSVGGMLAGESGISPQNISLLVSTVLGIAIGGTKPAVVTMDELRAMLGFISARKSANVTITSDDVVDDDADLAITLLANKTYVILGNIRYVSPAVADLTYRFTFPGIGHDVDIGILVTEADGGTRVQGTEHYTTTGAENDIASSGGDDQIRLSGVFEVGGGGVTMTFGWAQKASNGGNTTVYEGSYLLAIEI